MDHKEEKETLLEAEARRGIDLVSKESASGLRENLIFAQGQLARFLRARSRKAPGLRAAWQRAHLQRRPDADIEREVHGPGRYRRETVLTYLALYHEWPSSPPTRRTFAGT